MANSLIELEQMEFHALHGCYALEREVGNRYRVDATIEVDTTKVLQTDRVEDSINYLTVYELIKEQMEITSNTLEHVCGRIIEAIYVRFPEAVRVRVKVSKMAPPLGGKIERVSLTLEK